MSSWPTKELDLKLAAQFDIKYHQKQEYEPWFITISREYGCDGHNLVAELLKKLNEEEDRHPWYNFDRESLLKMSDPEEINEDVLALLEEYGHSEFQGYLQEAVFGQKSRYQVIRKMANIMRAMARRGNVILLGCGAAVLTKDFPLHLSVRINAPLEWRIHNYAKRHGCDKLKAEEMVRKHSDQRSAFLETYLAEPIDNPHLYDLVLNNATLPTELMADLVIKTLKTRRALPKYMR